MKSTCFHFQILYLRQRTFSFLVQRSRIKLSSLSLLMDMTHIATRYHGGIAKVVTSTNILLLILVLAFCWSNFGVVAGEGTALLLNTKDFSLFLCVGEVPRSSLSQEAKVVAKDVAWGFICPRKIHVKASYSDWSTNKTLLQGCQKPLKWLSQNFFSSLECFTLYMCNKLNRNSLVA